MIHFFERLYVVLFRGEGWNDDYCHCTYTKDGRRLPDPNCAVHKGR